MEIGQAKAKRIIAMLAVVCMTMSLIPGNVFAMEAKDKNVDIANHWAKDTILGWVDKGTIKGYEDGTFRPDNNITRAEFMSLVNGTFGYTQKSTIKNSDVAEGAWYQDVVSVANAAGYISGYPDGTMKPNNPISREEAAVILSKICVLCSDDKAAKKFTDSASITWSAGAVGAISTATIMSGYPDQSFQAKNNIKRAEAVVALDKAVSFSKNNTVYKVAGVYGPATGNLEIDGSVTVLAKDTTLQNMTIKGNLIIDKNVGEGNVTLKNVTVKGDTKVYGGGVNSIVVIDSTLGNVTVSKENGKIRIVISGNTVVSKLTANSGAKIEESNLTGNNAGFQEIVLDAEASDTIILVGSYSNVVVNHEGINLEMPKGTTVDNMVLNKQAVIKGEGTIAKAQVNASGVTFEKAPTKMDVSKDVSTPKVGQQPSTPATSGGGGGGGSSSSGGSSNPPIIVNNSVEILSKATLGMPSSEVKVKQDGSSVNTFDLYFDNALLASTTNGTLVVATAVLNDLARVKVKISGTLFSDSNSTLGTW